MLLWRAPVRKCTLPHARVYLAFRALAEACEGLTGQHCLAGLASEVDRPLKSERLIGAIKGGTEWSVSCNGSRDNGSR